MRTGHGSGLTGVRLKCHDDQHLGRVSAPHFSQIQLHACQMSVHDIPLELPPLPDIGLQHTNMHGAYQIVINVYRHGIRILQQDSPDILQISCQIDAITSNAVPLLEGIKHESEVNDIPLSENWPLECADLFGEMVWQLRLAKDLAAGR